MAALLQDMGINHGGAETIMAQQRLDGTDVHTALQKMGGKAVAKCMGADLFIDARLVYRPFDRLIDNARINMMTPCPAAPGINRQRP